MYMFLANISVLIDDIVSVLDTMEIWKAVSTKSCPRDFQHTCDDTVLLQLRLWRNPLTGEC
jgi:hypothetical protein